MARGYRAGAALEHVYKGSAVSVRIATYNVNGINGRLTNLLEWLKEAEPSVVCLQELKAPDEKFPAAAIRAAGYGAIWHGKKAGTASPSSRGVSNPWKYAAAYRAIPTTPIAAT
jgi:exonuclease III